MDRLIKLDERTSMTHGYEAIYGEEYALGKKVNLEFGDVYCSSQRYIKRTLSYLDFFQKPCRLYLSKQEYIGII